ncbi:uncharacterized protein LOC143488824 isoform X1 [Brachyhypopomus gauderio]|uniref:uncharacterized protein LOC143488824 isoform X1 n=1 Tax=Brachyhypopomus gauderio TaxID=698409 RepID=UPI0040431EAC
MSHPDLTPLPSPNSCQQSNFRSSPEPSPQSDCEAFFQASSETSPSPSPIVCSSPRSSPEPSPQIEQTCLKSCLPSTSKSSLELNSPPNPDSGSSPYPTLDSGLQADMRSSPETTSLKSRPNLFFESSSEFNPKPANESCHQPSLSCRSSPQLSLMSSSKYSLRSTSSRVSRANPISDNSGTLENELDPDASSGSDYNPLDDEDEWSDCSNNCNDSLDRPVAQNLTASVAVNSALTLSLSQDNSSQSKVDSTRDMEEMFGSDTVSSPQPSQNFNLNHSTSSSSQQLCVITCNKLNKRHFCVYCKKSNVKMARHLLSKHANETDVARALSFRKGSKRRRLLLDQLRKKGNYLHNIEVLQRGSGELVTCKRPSVDYSVSEYLPCQHCLAFYIRHDLWRHERACKMRKDNGTGCRRRIQSTSSKLLPAQGFCSGACEEIIRGMHQDSVLDHIREDTLICKYGDILLGKHGQDKKHHVYIAQKLRELGRFMLAVKEIDHSVQQLFQICTPSRFDLAINSAKKISGFDESSNKLEMPSLALKIGYSLRQTAEILFGDSFMGHDSEMASKAKEFIELLETNWISCVRMSSDLDIGEISDFDRCLESSSVAVTRCQLTEANNMESAVLAEVGTSSECHDEPRVPPDSTCSLQLSLNSTPEHSQNFALRSSPCSTPKLDGENLDKKQCEPVRSIQNEFHPAKIEKSCSSNTEEKSAILAAVPASRKKSTKNIRINSKFSTLSFLRANPRCKASSSKSKFSSGKSRVVKSRKTFGVRTIHGKKQSCLYCNRLVSKIARHLESKHAKEKDVTHALSFPKGSKTRKLLLKQLRNKGNYEHNIEVIQNGNGEIIPLKRPKKDRSLNDYEPCPHCLGFFASHVLWQHQRSCKMKNGKDAPRKRRCRGATFALHETLSVGCQDVVRHMRDDDISKHLRNDSLICKFGNRLYEKVGHQKAQHNYISQKMRELGRFMLAVKELDQNIEHLHQVCSESKFNLALESAKVIGGFDQCTNKFKTPVIVLKLGYSLKRATEIALAENAMGEEAAAQARKFIDLLETDWITFVSSHSCTSANKQNVVDVVRLTEDVIKLQNILRIVENKAKSELMERPNPDAWKRLRESLLAGITLFNRGRKWVADKMLLENYTYTDGAKEPFSGDKFDILTKLERSLSAELIRMEMSCEGGSTITFLLTKRMVSSLDLLIKCRKDVDIPMDNPYVFARMRASTYIRATDCLRNFAQNCGAGNPEGLTSGYTHKHVAVLYQIMSLNDDEKRHVAKLVGDDSYDYQGLNENSVQLAKICSLLHTMEQGTVPCRKSCDTAEGATADGSPGCPADVNGEITDAGLGQVSRSREKRKKWGEEEQQAVRKQMGKYISLRTVPGKRDCLECIRKEPDALRSRTWKDIKNYIHNTIQSNKRRMTARQMEEDHSESDGEDDGEDIIRDGADVDGLVKDGSCSNRRHLRRGRRRLVTDLESSEESSPSSSKLHHMYGVKSWESWVQGRVLLDAASPLTVKEDVLQCSSLELSRGLCHFICEVRRPSGQTYAPDSVYYLCLGIQQHLLENGRLENIFMDPLYSQFTSDITKLIKDWELTLPPSGFLQSRVEESFLWECKQLGALSPFVLLNTLLFFGVKMLGMKTVAQHQRLSFSHVTRCSRTTTDRSVSYLRFRFTEKDEDVEKRVVFGKRKREAENEDYQEMPENTENPLHCPVSLYEFYLSKCPDSVKHRPDLFYLQPLSSCHPDSPLWYSAQALEPSTLESMLTRALAVRDVHLGHRAGQQWSASSDESS